VVKGEDSRASGAYGQLFIISGAASPFGTISTSPGPACPRWRWISVSCFPFPQRHDQRRAYHDHDHDRSTGGFCVAFRDGDDFTTDGFKMETWGAGYFCHFRALVIMTVTMNSTMSRHSMNQAPRLAWIFFNRFFGCDKSEPRPLSRYTVQYGVLGKLVRGYLSSEAASCSRNKSTKMFQMGSASSFPCCEVWLSGTIPGSRLCV